MNAVRTTLIALVATGCAPVEQPVDDPTLDCDASIGVASIAVNDDGDSQSLSAPMISWEGEEAWAVAVTSPGARIGAYGRVVSG